MYADYLKNKFVALAPAFLFCLTSRDAIKENRGNLNAFIVKDHRIAESLGLEGTSEHHLVQLPDL